MINYSMSSFLLTSHFIDFSFLKVAVKSIRKEKIKDEQDLIHIRREIEIMSSLCHPHVITIYEGTLFQKQNTNDSMFGFDFNHSVPHATYKRDILGWGKESLCLRFRVLSRTSLCSSLMQSYVSGNFLP